MNINDAIHKANLEIHCAEFERFLALMDDFKVSVYESLRLRLKEIESKALLLKLTNLFVAKYEYLHRHSFLISYPISLIVDPSNACNLYCPGCVHSKTPEASNAFLWPSGNLSLQKFNRFIQKYGPYAFQVILCNNGEPFLNKLTPQFIKISREYLAETVSSTSLNVKKLDVNQLVLSGLDFLTLSIDGATRETYSIFRKGGNFDLVIDNLERLISIKKEYDAYSPFLSWQFLVFEHNFHEIEKVKFLAKSIGVNELRFATPGSVTWDDPSINVKNSFEEQLITFDYSLPKERNNRDKMLANLNPKVINRHFSKSWLDVYSNIDKRLAQRSVEIITTCEWLYQSITMDALGNIIPCCMTPSRNRELLFSTIDADDPFNSDMYVFARDHFSNKPGNYDLTDMIDNGREPFCTSCSHNKIAQLITPQHVKNYLERVKVFDVLSNQSKRILSADYI